MKCIFLDIDGVLNSRTSEKKNKALGFTFTDNPDPMHIRWLNLIIQKTGALVVISSVWRKQASYLSLWRFFELQGFKGRIVGITPDLDDIRGNEIKAWMARYENGKDWRCKREEHGPIESYVIIDDDNDMGTLMGHLVRTKSKVGLIKRQALEAIKILNYKRST